MLNRRKLLKTVTAAGLASVLPLTHLSAFTEAKKHNIKQSVCLWCYNGYLRNKQISFEDFCKFCQELGLKSIELTGPKEWETMKKYGLICAMSNSHSIPHGFNRPENHKNLIEKVKKSIDETSAAGFPNVICFSGNCNGMDKKEGLKKCAAGLKELMPYAKEKKVVICMEFLNSKDHKDYMADSTEWCTALVNEVASDHFRILYDIYHAAMMDENPLKDIEKHHLCWGHYHTAGFPGRAEIDTKSQKLDYAELMLAISTSGYTGFVGQEFCPRRDAFQSLKEAVEICNIQNPE
ncbi:MAG: sugar phosphate isomerase/epimerase [Planctomycetia bacterium]|nr:sugar phosphate isomerase/epimerase [Planctomycetia bacterium]